MPGDWDIWIDTGGTFTDCLARDPDGRLHRAKVLSSSTLRATVIEQIDPCTLRLSHRWTAPPGVLAGMRVRMFDRGELLDLGLVGSFEASDGRLQVEAASRDHRHTGSRDAEATGLLISPGSMIELQSAEEAPILAARLVTQTPGNQPLPSMRMRLATTRGTNALLECRGGRMALFITRGFADLLLIGNQQRADLFALKIQKPPPLSQRVIEVDERLSADGSVLRAIDQQGVERSARELRAAGIDSAAVALLHSYRNPHHEQVVADVLRSCGFRHVSCSSDLAPLIEILPRAQTAVVDAYLTPVIDEYLDRIVSALGGSSLHVMTSAGGLSRREGYRAKDSLLSGPAGGVMGAIDAARASGFSHIIGFDMGGTSTDVARSSGRPDYIFEHSVGPARLMAPAISIHTVAAGGGSICRFEDGRLHVGPQSAGAAPGPACYGAGGPLTLTDVNLLLGRLDPDQFEIPIAREPAQRALDQVVGQVNNQHASTINADALLGGFIDIADQRMAEAIEHVSIRRGYDPAEHALLAFGGAGAQHACGVAERLGMRTIIVPADAALLSASGLGAAVIERFAQRQVLRLLDDVRAGLVCILDELEREAIDDVASQGIERGEIQVTGRWLHMRLSGQDATISIELEEGCDVSAAFEAQYEAIYGHAPRDRPIEVESIRVVAASRESSALKPAMERSNAGAGAGKPRYGRACFEGRRLDVPAFNRDDLPVDWSIDGPALIVDRRSTCVVRQGWRASIDQAGAVIMRRFDSISKPGAGPRAKEQADIVRVELLTGRLTAIAEDMGHVLQRTALSTNVKQRLDFSCGVLNAACELVVNAPHIPVHLGGLGECVRAVREVIDMRPGDVIVTNHPRFGGSHLPDVTVITPVHASKENPRLIGYVASRAHHAEIGGSRPGSMPPDATSLAEEGVVIEPIRLVDAGRDRFDRIDKLLRSGRYPSRAVDENLADLRAAVAANRRGEQALQRLAREHGVDSVIAMMSEITDRAAALGTDAIASLFRRGRSFAAREDLDDGSPLCVRIELSGGKATFDFAGSAPQHPRNLNATTAIVRSAVLYVLRLLIGRPIPLNEGLLRAVDLRIPPGILNPAFHADPARCPAVVGGNTETSQRLVDMLLKALGLVACSQGTMNNVLFGDDRVSYYETVCGGSGAGDGFDGADAVHTHMTNTRITDPEILEHRFPVRLERFAIRRDSGGGGRFRGGDGAAREIVFLRPMSLSILSQHRTVEPYGLHGGNPGLPGRQRVIRSGGAVVELQSIDGCEVAAGDRLILETPGGGGWGASSSVGAGSSG
jgi:5-oxoprolinase (ATP-hydrolysing)